MRLLLHIGMGKTGTSTLQRTLRTNRSRLAKAGVLYPKGDRFPLKQHQGLMSLAVSPERLPREFGTLRDMPPAEVEAIAEEFWSDIRSQVEAAKPQTTILSYESLFYLGPEELHRLHQRLREISDDIGVVAYVRHPSTHWLSVSQQKVKASHRITPPGTYHNALSTHLKTFLTEFDGSVSARAFDPLVLEDRCIVADFLHHHVAGGEGLRQVVTVHNENESMSAEAMCILQALRRHAFADTSDVFAPESDEALAVLRSLEAAEPGTAPVLHPGLQDVLTANHQAELDWLRNTFDMSFPSAMARGDGEGPGRAPSADVLESTDLRQILLVDPEKLERTLYLVLKELATRSLASSPPASAVDARMRPTTRTSVMPERLGRLLGRTIS